MWLASMSMRNPVSGRIISTEWWTRNFFSPEFLGRERTPVEILHWILDGVGDPERERCFRMNVTLCLHRGVTAEEKARLPESFHRDRAGLAGGPVEVLWTKGVNPGPAGDPCRNPGRDYPDPGRSDLWRPIDCGKCEPCLGRIEAARRH